MVHGVPCAPCLVSFFCILASYVCICVSIKSLFSFVPPSVFVFVFVFVQMLLWCRVRNVCERQVPSLKGFVTAVQKRTVVSQVHVYVSESDDPYLNLAAEEWSVSGLWVIQKGNLTCKEISR